MKFCMFSYKYALPQDYLGSCFFSSLSFLAGIESPSWSLYPIDYLVLSSTFPAMTKPLNGSSFPQKLPEGRKKVESSSLS